MAHFLAPAACKQMGTAQQTHPVPQRGTPSHGGPLERLTPEEQQDLLNKRSFYSLASVSTPSWLFLTLSCLNTV